MIHTLVSLCLLVCVIEQASDRVSAQGGGIFADGFETGDSRAWSGSAVGPGGGRVVAAGGAVVLDFPPGALDSGVLPTVSPIDASSVPGAVAGTFFDFGPDGLQFRAPVTVTLAYDPAAVGVAESDLRLVKLATDGVLEIQPSTPADTAAHRVTGQLEGFSPYGVGGCGVIAPPVLSATYNANRSVTLEWTSGAPLAAALRVERAVTNGFLPPLQGDWTPFTTVSNGLGSLTHFVGPAAAVYWYRMREDFGPSSPCRSVWSAPVRVIVFGLQPSPPAPGRPSAVALSCGGVRLVWNPVLEASGYRLERAELGVSGFQPIAQLGGTELFFVDTDSSLVPGATYRYLLRAVNASGLSLPSPPVDVQNSVATVTVGLSQYSLAVPPGGSTSVDVALLRQGGATLDVQLSAAIDLPQGVSLQLLPEVASGDSTLMVDVDPAAGIGLSARGRVFATPLSGPGAGTLCSVPFELLVGEPGCTLQTTTEVTLTPSGSAIADLQVDRIGVGGPFTLDHGGVLQSDGVGVTFVPNPTFGRASILLDDLGSAAPLGTQWVEMLSATSQDSSIVCQRELLVELLADFVLLVNKSGSGSGTVVSLGTNDIDCGSDCVETFASAGTLVGLQATPDPGSTFVAWQGCDDADGDICVVTVDGQRTVTAEFSSGP